MDDLWPIMLLLLLLSLSVYVCQWLVLWLVGGQVDES